ncbi:MAG: hypothetical protein Q8O76_08950 [Chloroflexota bacterium]|nr:hypothetical protein [Chloroflexota bacterium]
MSNQPQDQDQSPLDGLRQLYSDPRIRAAARTTLEALVAGTTPETQKAIAEFVMGAASVSRQAVVELRRLAVGLGVVSQEEADGMGIQALLKLMTEKKPKKQSRRTAR